jgi:hypothetical protein
MIGAHAGGRYVRFSTGNLIEGVARTHLGFSRNLPLLHAMAAFGRDYVLGFPLLTSLSYLSDPVFAVGRLQQQNH